ncbi:ATP-dependent DNA ligase [Nanoarchaeota archaeon]
MKSMKFNKLSELFSKLEKISSTNAIKKELAEFFRKTPKNDIGKVCYFLMGSISSGCDDIVIGMADKMVIKSISLASNSPETDVRITYKKMGDIGKTAEHFIGKKQEELTVQEVHEKLMKIATSSGSGSQEKKVRTLADMFKNVSPLDSRYIARIVSGKLRLGIGDKLIMDGLALGIAKKKEARKDLEKAFMICPDIGLIAKTLLEKGLKGVKRINVVTGRPIQVMLAQRAKTFEEISKKMPGKKGVEEKYDGERIQVHVKKNKIILFSRRLENVTHQFPDVANALKKAVKQNCIIEGEVVPVDKNSKILPFQKLMSRRRKHKIEEYVKKIPVVLFLFDCLSSGNKTIMYKSYPERKKELKSLVKQNKTIKLANTIYTDDPKKIAAFFKQSIKDGLEGIMLKSCSKDSIYQAGTRGWLWIKWKKEYAKNIRDTFDVVVIGAYYGKGRRSGMYGALLCAVLNTKTNKFETVCKVGSGFTDKDLKELPKKLKKHETKDSKISISKTLIPDVLFTPKVVIEVIAAEVTKSPIHSCGYALRFPRFVRFRDDKSARQATTKKEILSFK